MHEMKLNTQADAILFFIERLDIEMVDDLLDSERTYSDLEKPVFVHKLGKAFDKLIEAGDSNLIRKKGVCTGNGCDNIGCPGYTFLGEKSGLFLDLVIIERDGKIEDIFDCAELDSEASNRKYENRVRVDKLEFPF
jgi:hypothetical protein